MAVTLKDIANEVGLNISTVSRILSQPTSSVASEVTRRQVVEAARRLGYRPNAAARALASGRSGCVGIFAPELQDPVFGHYIEVICDLLAEHGINGVAMRSGWKPDREMKPLESLQTRQIDAALSLFYHHEHRDLYQQLHNQGLVVVFRVVDEPIENIGLDCVGVDVSDAYESLIRHMVERGYRRVAIIGGLIAEALAQPHDRHSARDISASQVAASHAYPGVYWVHKIHHELGLTFDPRLAIPCGPTAAQAYQALRRHLQDPNMPRFDGLIIQANKFIPGVQRALAEHSLQISHDVGLASVSDSEICQFGAIPITVWNQPIEKICQGMVRLLMRRLAAPNAPIATSSYSSHLIIRESTAGKRGA